MANYILYRPLKGYKYQLMEAYQHPQPLSLRPAKDLRIPHDTNLPAFILLETNGTLHIKNGYAWDGPSGPTFDTKDFMRGSLVHDALYQLIRSNLLSMDDRIYADQVLYDICIEDGMNRPRAWVIRKVLNWFGGPAAKPKSEEEELKITKAP